jgi:hypothetical protein
MPRHAFDITASSSLPIEAVWTRLADIPGWRSWAGPLVGKPKRSRDGAPEPDGVGAIRQLGAFPIVSREEIVAFDRPTHLAYTILGRAAPVRGYRADVDLTPSPTGGTTIRWRAMFDATVPGTGGAVRFVLSRVIQRLAGALAAR